MNAEWWGSGFYLRYLLAFEEFGGAFIPSKHGEVKQR